LGIFLIESEIKNSKKEKKTYKNNKEKNFIYFIADHSAIIISPTSISFEVSTIKPQSSFSLTSSEGNLFFSKLIILPLPINSSFLKIIILSPNLILPKITLPPTVFLVLVLLKVAKTSSFPLGRFFFLFFSFNKIF
jgi:hypothetical protein